MRTRSYLFLIYSYTIFWNYQVSTIAQTFQSTQQHFGFNLLPLAQCLYPLQQTFSSTDLFCRFINDINSSQEKSTFPTVTTFSAINSSIDRIINLKRFTRSSQMLKMICVYGTSPDIINFCCEQKNDRKSFFQNFPFVECRVHCVSNEKQSSMSSFLKWTVFLFFPACTQYIIYFLWITTNATGRGTEKFVSPIRTIEHLMSERTEWKKSSWNFFLPSFAFFSHGWSFRIAWKRVEKGNFS